jgi:hypothetical protein
VSQTRKLQSEILLCSANPGYEELTICTEGMINGQKILVGKSEGKTPQDI